MLTLILIPITFVLVAVGAWLLTRDTTAKPPPPPGRHRRTARDPHDPIRDDDQEPPDQGL